MLTSITLFRAAAMAAPLALLAGCGEPETIVAGAPADDQSNQVAAAPPVELPPSVAASRTYRCKDNSLVYIDILSDNRSANFRTEPQGTPTRLTAPAEGQPLVAEGGYEMSGIGETITLTRPGKPAQSCKA